MTAAADVNLSAMSSAPPSTTKPRSNSNSSFETMTPTFRLDDHRSNSNSASTSRNSATPRISHKRGGSNTLKSKLLKLGSLKRETSLTSDSSSITTSSTLDDTSDSHSAAALAVGIHIRHLPADRQPLLPPRSPLQHKQMVESLHKQFFPQHVLPTPIALSCQSRVVADAERFLGPIDVDDIVGDDSEQQEGVEIVETFSDLSMPSATKTTSMRASAPDSTATTTSAAPVLLRPKFNPNFMDEDSQELDKFLRQWQSSSSSSNSNRGPQIPMLEDASIATSSTAPIDVDSFLSDMHFSPQDYEEFVLDEVELCRELAGYQEGCEPEWITDCSLMTWNEEEEEDNEECDVLRKDAPRHRRNNTSAAATANSKSTSGKLLQQSKRPPIVVKHSSATAAVGAASAASASAAVLRRPLPATYSRSVAAVTTTAAATATLHRPHLVSRIFSSSALPSSAAEV